MNRPRKYSGRLADWRLWKVFKVYRVRLSFIFAACFTMLLVFGLGKTKFAIDAEQASWDSFSNHEMPLALSLKELDQALGYGGFIHSFKNYILRHEDLYAQTAKTRIKEARMSLDTISGLYPASDDVGRAVADIQATLDVYENNLLLAMDRLNAPNAAVTEHQLDSLVRVDDGNALRALTTLNRIASEGLQRRETESLALVTNTRSTLNAGLLFGLFIAVGSFLLAWLMEKTQTSRKQLSQTLNQVNHLIDKHPDGILLVDDTGLIQRCNAQVCSIFGYDEAELIGQSVDILVPTSFRRKHLKHREDYTAAPEMREMATRSTIYGVTKAGKELPLQINLNRIAQGNDFVTVAACKDLSLAVEQAKELQQAVKAAEKAAEARGRFLAVMSHELRTPLNGIIGFSDLMKYSLANKDFDPSQIIEYAEQVVRSSRHLLGIVNDVLDFSAAEHNGMKMRNEPLDLSMLVQNIKSLTAYQCQEANITLTVNCADNLPECVIADRKRFTQVLLNLIGNAVKFTKNGSIEISVYAEQVKDRLVRINVSVADTGIGIPADKLDTIFKPFEQVEGDSTRSFDGTGLGLAISNSIIEAMNGKIWAESAVGEGTTVHFHVEMEDASEIYRSLVPQLSPTRPFNRKMMDVNVLAVDDLELNGTAIKSILEPLGATVTWVSSGMEALEILGQQTFDLVLMDLHMPKMNGIETAQKIRENFLNKECPPIFAWTADVLYKFHDDESPWAGIITKPTLPDEIVDLISNRVVLH